MAMPKYDELTGLLLKLAADQKEHSLQEAYELLVKHFNLTEEDKNSLLPSGKQTIFENRVSEETPEEMIERGYQVIKEKLIQELLERIRACEPGFFERLIVELLVKIGYGGSLQNAGQAIGKSGDGGIDGIIKEDRLGLDLIYLQAKRWEGTVGRPEIQKFAGALQGGRARKGVFITTSSFSPEAIEYASRIDYKIILIDGIDLAELMIEYNLGVSDISIYTVKRWIMTFFPPNDWLSGVTCSCRLHYPALANGRTSRSRRFPSSSAAISRSY